MAKEIKETIVVKKNNKSNISIIVNNTDELSFDSIHDNAKNIMFLEENFNERINFSNEQITKKCYLRNYKMILK